MKSKYPAITENLVTVLLHIFESWWDMGRAKALKKGETGTDSKGSAKPEDLQTIKRYLP
jgi:hypothetical protein